MIAAIIWTIIFVGGDLAALVWLLAYAMHKDRQKLRNASNE
jgi:hypothetical protein